MSLWNLLTRLFRKAARADDAEEESPRADLYSFTRDHAWLLASLELPGSVFHDIVQASAIDPFGYRHFTTPKKDGGRREITEPDARLKRLQRHILNVYLTLDIPHPAALAFRPGLSIANHAWTHAGAEILIIADIQDFFPNTLEHRIENYWQAHVAEDLARLFTLLTTHQGALPQGAPTSPALSNVVNRPLDEALTQLVGKSGGRYSRYCDDLAFSWPGQSVVPADFESVARATLHSFGYTLHPAKGWHIYQRHQEPELVGLILTRRGRVRLPLRLRHRMRQLAASANSKDAARLAGYKGYEKMVVRRPGTGTRNC